MLTNKERMALEAELATMMIAAANPDKPEGMRALAAAIAEPIKTIVDQKEIASLLLTRHTVPKGETAKYQKQGEVTAFWMSDAGDVLQSKHLEEEVEFSMMTLAAKPTMKLSTLESGNAGDLMDKIRDASKDITKKLNSRAVSLVSAAVPAANTVEISGGELTKEGLSQAMGKLEDQELVIKAIVLRGSLIGQMRSMFDLDPVTEREFIEKGVVAKWNGALVINSASVDSDEVLILGDDEAGKFGVRRELTSNETKAGLGDLEVGAIAHMECAMGVTRPEVLAKCVILPAT